MTPDQLAALRRIAEAAAGAERATGCPAESRLPSALWNRRGSMSRRETTAWHQGQSRRSMPVLPHEGVLERQVGQPGTGVRHLPKPSSVLRRPRAPPRVARTRWRGSATKPYHDLDAYIRGIADSMRPIGLRQQDPQTRPRAPCRRRNSGGAPAGRRMGLASVDSECLRAATAGR